MNNEDLIFMCIMSLGIFFTIAISFLFCKKILKL